MARSVGLVVTEHAAAGVVEDGRLAGEIRAGMAADALRAMPAEDLAGALAGTAASLSEGAPVEAVGLAVPGIVRAGVIEESPNLQQLKGFAIEAAMADALGRQGLRPRLAVSNDADAMAAGIAAIHGGLDKLVRVWTLGAGVGFGHYPAAEGVWEGGHTVVSLDPSCLMQIQGALSRAGSPIRTMHLAEVLDSR